MRQNRLDTMNVSGGALNFTHLFVAFVSGLSAAVKSTKEISSKNVEAEEPKNAAAARHSEKQKNDKRKTDATVQRSAGCKLYSVPETGLYEHLVAKLKRPAYLAKMRKQLAKNEGKVQFGKGVVCIARTNLKKLLRLLDRTDNIDQLKSCKKRKRFARRLSNLLQCAAHS